MTLRTLLVVAALAAAAAAASQPHSKRDQMKADWAARIKQEGRHINATGAAVLRGLRGERLAGVQRAVDWLNDFMYPKILADVLNFVGRLRLESLLVERSADLNTKKKVLAAWPRNLTALQHSDMANLRTTLKALVVHISGQASGPQIHNVRVALSAAEKQIIQGVEKEQKADQNLLSKHVAMFS